MKPFIKKSLLALLYTFVVVFGWEMVNDHIIPENTVEMVREAKYPTTVEGIVEERAKSWLKSPEALELAKTKVTEQLVEELSKK
jgi:hypothetical protein